MARTSDDWRDLAHGIIEVASVGAHIAIDSDRRRTPSQRKRDQFGVLVARVVADVAIDALVDWLSEGD